MLTDSTTIDANSVKPVNSTSVVFEYQTAYNALVEPDKYVPATRYFIRRWMPLLGGTGTQIVLALRSLGFYNRATGELRDGIEIDMPALAALVGISVATLKREFGDSRDPKAAPGSLKNPALHKFITREKQYRRDAQTNIILRCLNVYRVRMDDPLHEDDLPRFQEIVESMEKGAAEEKDARNSRKAQDEPYRFPVKSARKAQSEPYSVQPAQNMVQNELPVAQNDSRKAQNAPSLKDDSFLPKNKKDDSPATGAASAPAASSEFSTSLFSQKDRAIRAVVNAKQSPETRWEKMTDDERCPFCVQAEGELTQHFGEKEWIAFGRKTRHIELRAKSLFLDAQKKEAGNDNGK